MHFSSSPPGTEILIYHLMDLFISYLTRYNYAEWNLAFRKFSALSYAKEILVDNKHLKQTSSLRKSQFQIGYAIAFSLAKMAFHCK